MKLLIQGGFTKRLFHSDRLAIFIHVLLLVILVPAEAKHAKKPSRKSGNQTLSTSLECTRQCYKGEPPKICYYHFTVETYTVLGGACKLCTPDNSNNVNSTCQCVTADGVERSISSVNRMLPGPSIQVCLGDTVVIDVFNKIDGMQVTIHWHGILQKGTQYYDGVPLLTQCPIHQGDTFRYQWYAADPGTHFWHAHTGLQKLDGLFGSIAIREPVSLDPNGFRYDHDLPEHVMVISDWMHEQTTNHFPGLLMDSGQLPDTLLINGKGQFRYPNGTRTKTPLKIFNIIAGYKYRFRIVNAFCSVCPAHITFENHNMTIIATDGEPVHPMTVNNIISTAGERYDCIIVANQPPGDYWIHLRGLGECGDGDIQQLGILRYQGPHKKLRSPPPNYNRTLFDGVLLNPLDGMCSKPRPDSICINQLKTARPIDMKVLTGTPDVKIFLPFRFLLTKPKETFKPNTYKPFMVSPRKQTLVSLIDEISFEYPPSPPVSQSCDIPRDQYCNGQNRPKDCGEQCTCTHKINIPLGGIVECILVDEVGAANLSHPFHLHGYSFYVIATGRSQDKNITKINVRHVIDLDKRGLIRRMFDKPPKKDTLPVPDNGYVVLRFRADNPGYWLLHCHFLYHVVIGMDVVLHVGKQSDLPPVPPNFPKCGDFLPEINPLGH